MALANYTDLKNSVINWSHRDDMDLLIDDFIKLAETEFYNNDAQPLMIREMETITTQSENTKLVTLPTDYESMRSVKLVLSQGAGELQYRAPEQMIKYPDSGQPRYYTIVGNQLEFDRTPDATYSIEFQYFKKIAALTSVATTNTILTNHPNIYLFGCLWALFTHVEDEPVAQKYYTRFISAIRGANKADKRGRYGPAPSARIEGYTP